MYTQKVHSLSWGVKGLVAAMVAASVTHADLPSSSSNYSVSSQRTTTSDTTTTTTTTTTETKSYYDAVDAKPYIPWTFPGINVMSPAGYGAQWGNLFVGIGLQSRTRYTTSADGALGAGFGIGNSKKNIGIETSVSVLSMTGSDAFGRGGFNFKVSRQLPLGFGIAVGRENAFGWGTLDGSRSWYGSISKIFFTKPDPSQWFSAVTLTAGVGDGRFRSEADTRIDRNSVNFFASAAVRLREPASLIVDWSGQDLNLGLSLTPFRTVPVYINPAIVDVTKNAGDGARFILGIGYAYSFT